MLSKKIKVEKKIPYGKIVVPVSIKNEGLAGESQFVAFTQIPDEIAGMTLEKLPNDYKDRIFNQYLPFWDKGGYDQELGGFMCELEDDGSVVNGEKYIWYQGRGIWVYSYLYNNFGKEKRFLETAKKSRDFLLKYMYLGDGKWRESVNRQGQHIESTVAQGSAKDIYGALFSAAGLIELYKADGNKNDLEIAKKSIWIAVHTYDQPDYEGVWVPGIVDKGLRSQGHSFIIIWILTNLLSFHHDPELEKIENEHINHIINDFWNPEYQIANEILMHNYNRIPVHDAVMFTGHSLEAFWMVMDEAIRKKDKRLFEICKQRIRHVIEMNWDYIFGGFCSEDYFVLDTVGKCAGPSYESKLMWAHTELLIATMKILELTGEIWAKEWYERGRKYCLNNMANTGNGVWREAVDRFGENKKRPGISCYRKCNFHQIRYQMMNLLSLERMIKNGRKPWIR